MRRSNKNRDAANAVSAVPDLAANTGYFCFRWIWSKCRHDNFSGCFRNNGDVIRISLASREMEWN